MKKCPFCKNEIRDDAATCPMCNMVLIEKLPPRPKAKEVPKQKSPEQKAYQYYPPNSQPAQGKSSKGSNMARNVLISIGLSILVSGLLSSGRSLTSGPAEPLPPPVAESSTSNGIQTAPSNFLSTGTILTKNRNWLNGNGTLLIKNGSGSDAVVKLVPSTYGKSVYTVYVRTDSDYTIPDIKDGTYKLLFIFGEDWNSTEKIFNRNQRGQMFDEGFDYMTTSYDDDEYTHVKYSTYTITLNPVVGGTATTTPIDQDLFNKY